ncbi:MAG: serine/threonine protein kinase, partial [Lentisphaerae bacterium]|nr:serine/threonine protein kinase [Lentisphaerota bacterium]
MAESSSGRSPLQAFSPGESAVGDLQSQPQENGEERIIFAPGGQISDEAPTIISKNKPAPVDNNAQNSLRGRTLAHFELLEPIGVGGMAAVLRARDKELDRIVALKILPPEMAADPENVQRFHQEARAAAKLDHENIARVFYCGEDQHLHFIAFEYVEGENLRTILERRGRLPVPEAVRYILQIAAGLEHAASRGVVHRDIKPSNIIISPSGRAKLVDMGLARSLGRRDGKGLTQSGVTLGTFDYLSPEQALEPREADVRSDIYSLGCTFYHVLTGQPPVPEGTAAKKLHHHQHVSPVDPRQLNPDIPDEVAIILHRMMAKDPRERYQHPVHLIHHLMQVAQKVGAGADVPEGVMFVDAPLPEPPRKRPLLAFSLAAFALGVVLTAISLTPPLRTFVTPMRPGSGNKNDSSQGAREQPSAVVVKPLVPSSPSAPRPITSEHDLAKALAEERSTLHLQVANTIEITEPNLLFQGKSDGANSGRSLVLESKDALEPQTVRIKYQSRPEMPEWWAGLLIEGGSVTFRHLD